jgi:hypothetical protein
VPFQSTTRQIVRQARIAPDPYRAVRERSVEAAPGTALNYNGGGVWLLGLTLNKVSGLPLDPRQKGRAPSMVSFETTSMRSRSGVRMSADLLTAL